MQMGIIVNKYSFDEIEVGHTEEFTVTVTEKQMQQFLEITSDTNPLHNDRAFARKRNYRDRVVYGMLTASFLSTLAGVYLPGENSLIHSVETKFMKPVYPGDELTVKGTVVDKNEAVQMLMLKVTIKNQETICVMKADMKVGILYE